MKAYIIEDEQMARAQLMRLLAANFPDIEVVGSADSVTGAVEFLSTSPGIDVIFMDVELSDGDCFEIFRKLSVKTPVIMTTAYDSYAIKAFEAGSVDYLLKPVDLGPLQRAVGRVRERSAQAVDITALLAAIGSPAAVPSAPAPKQYKERSVVRAGDRIIPMTADEIAYFYSEDKANYLMTHEGEKYIIESTIEQLSSELDPAKFCRISRGCIVSRPAVKSVSRHFSGRYLVVATPPAPFEMTVSRARVEDFLSWLG